MEASAGDASLQAGDLAEAHPLPAGNGSVLHSESRNDPRRLQTPRSGTSTVRLPTPHATAEEAEDLSIRDIVVEEGSALQRALHVVSTDLTRRNSLSHVPELEPAQMSPRKVAGREITQDHAQYLLSYGMMLGIRVTVGRQQWSARPEIDDIPDDEDFKYKEKLVFPPEGSAGGAGGAGFATPPHRLPQAFKFKSYAPRVYRALRRRFGIDEADYMLSLAGDFNYIEFLANSKSGQFFFYSHDGRYMIKTQTKDECVFLRNILGRYYSHIMDHADTLITRFYGMYRVKMKHIRKTIHFVVMASVFDTPLPIHLQFDLKGSTVGRETTDADKLDGKVQKDMDFIAAKRRLHLGHLRDHFINTLREDTGFLASLNIMDYSLLVGIHERGATGMGTRHQSVTLTYEFLQRQTETSLTQIEQPIEQVQRKGLTIWTEFDGGVQGCAQRGQEHADVYFMGVIDILQRYNSVKRMENFFKGFKYDRSSISAVDALTYARRFVNFLTDHST